MKTHKQFLDWLMRNVACDPAIKWVVDNNLTAQEAWDQCHRGDWLLWWCVAEKVENRLLTLAAGKCAETVIHLMTDQRSKDAVKASIDYGNGLIKLDELKVYARASRDVFDYAADAVFYAAADSAHYAADAADASGAALYAAHAFSKIGGQKACEDNQKLTADIVRSIIKPTWL